ncbi:MAG: protease inhibitor I42 family protein [Clostridiales bacterium]|nr:protease inhibitor I42 family protein [Clostridiales bacterium]MCD7828801.1 protease inhibitor I42 family protein [Clostridiales bacterium]
MKHSINKKIAVLCAIIMLFSVITVFAVADENNKVNETATETETYSGEEDSTDADDDYTYVSEIYRPGDVNLDSKISAADARLALRASAKLDELDELQLGAALVVSGTDGNITASCARQILRVAADLDTFETQIFAVRIGSTLELYPLENAADGGYLWTYTITPVDEDASEDGIIVTHDYTELPSTYATGYSADDIFSFTGVAEGTYRVDMKLSRSWEEDAIDEFSFEIYCGYFATGLIWDSWETISEHLVTETDVFE